MCLKVVFYIMITISVIDAIVCDDEELMRIFNGVSATIEDYPHTVILYKDGQQHCGGSIISEDIIMTAAHCLYDVEAEDLSVSAGTNDCREILDEYRLEDFVIHEKYCSDNLKNDIGLIKLKRPLRLRPGVQPAKIIGPGKEIASGRIVRIAGCGMIDERGVKRAAKKLTSATLSVLDDEECSDLEPQFNAESLMCLRDDKEHKSVCHGDSGSGFMMDGKIVGVVSYGPKICGDSPISGATKVSMFVPWIQKHIEKLNGKPAKIFGADPIDLPENKPDDEKSPEEDMKEKQKEILKTKFPLTSEEYYDDSQSNEDSFSSDDESNEDHKESAKRHKKHLEEMKRSLKQMVFRMNMFKNIQLKRMLEPKNLRSFFNR